MADLGTHIFRVNAESVGTDGKPTGVPDAYEDMLFLSGDTGIAFVAHGQPGGGYSDPVKVDVTVTVMSDSVYYILNDLKLDTDNNGKLDGYHYVEVKDGKTHFSPQTPIIGIDVDGAMLTGVSDELMDKATYEVVDPEHPLEVPEPQRSILDDFMQKNALGDEVYEAVNDAGTGRSILPMDFNKDGGADKLLHFYSPDAAKDGQPVLNYGVSITPYLSAYQTALKSGGSLMEMKGPGVRDMFMMQILEGLAPAPGGGEQIAPPAEPEQQGLPNG